MPASACFTQSLSQDPEGRREARGCNTGLGGSRSPDLGGLGLGDRFWGAALKQIPSPHHPLGCAGCAGIPRECLAMALSAWSLGSDGWGLFDVAATVGLCTFVSMVSPWSLQYWAICSGTSSTNSPSSSGGASLHPATPHSCSTGNNPQRYGPKRQ